MAYGDGDRGIGGWLAFFLVTLGIISPAYLAISGWITLRDPQLPLAYGAMWPTLFWSEIALAAVMIGICWFTCYRFLRVRNATTPVIGITALWVLAVLGVVGEPLLVSSVTGISFGTLMQLTAGAGLIRPFVYAGVWTAFLLKSTRVDATYREPYSEVEVGEVFD